MKGSQKILPVKIGSKRIILILGMHRCGTSAVARLMKVFDVDLGHRLMPSSEGNNAKGFFEDIDFFELNVRMMHGLLGDWDQLRQVSNDELSELEGTFLEEASKLVEEKTRNLNILGLKDPRFCKLLPFWKRVFDLINIDVTYILCVRDPIEVAHSLYKRDGLGLRHGQLMWISHTLAVLSRAELNRSIVVDYNALIANPRLEIKRLGQCLDLEINPVESNAYEAEFLDKSLRHFHKPDMVDQKDPGSFNFLASRIYQRLTKEAEKRLGGLDQRLQADLREWVSQYVVVEWALADLDRHRYGLADEYKRLMLDAEYRLRQSQEQTSSANGELERLQTQLLGVREQFSEVKAHLTSIEEKYKSALSDRDFLKEQLSNQAFEISALRFALNSVYASRSWQLSVPVRIVGGVLRRLLTPARKARYLVLQSYCILRSQGPRALAINIYDWVSRAVGQASATETPSLDPYFRWVQLYDPKDLSWVALIKTRSDTLAQKPLISVVMPTFNSNIEWLRAAIQSVQRQVYSNWELCIADDASTSKATLRLLRQYQQDDSRIKVSFRKSNGHISAASNTALELVKGEWVALLDHDDLLSIDALYWVVDEINKNPSAMLIYTDEDKLDQKGRRWNPYFKSDWNRELFYAQNMISHLGVYRARRVREIGGFREGFEGSQDYDLALRFIEGINADQIRHIPRVLYHWRMHPKSTAQSDASKPYAKLSAQRALEEHFARCNLEAEVQNNEFGLKPLYKLPQLHPRVSILIPTRNAAALVKLCIESLTSRTTYKNYEVLLIDNGSNDSLALSYFKELEAQGLVTVLRDDRPFNFSALNNRAATKASGELLCLLNNDVEVLEPNWLSLMVAHAVRDEIGAVGAKLLYPNDHVQHAGVLMGIGGGACHAHKGLNANSPGYFGRACLTNEFSAVTAACLVVRRDRYFEVGGLDEENLAVAFNDTDFCLKLRERGYRNIFEAQAVLVHHESATRGADDLPAKIERFQAELQFLRTKWSKYLEHDPAYSPNLTLDSEDFSLAWPPRHQLLPTCEGS
jgi:glycosyltransferase involved in cell wall biosynthesis